MSEQRLREIAEREVAATPGQWITAPCGSEDCWCLCIGIEGEPENGKFICPSGSLFADDATFIAHARQDIPWLIANTNNALAYCDRILSHNPNGAELMFLTEVKRILTGESDGRPTTEGTDGR